MRRLFIGEQSGMSRSELRWGASHGRWHRVIRGVYGEGPEEPTALDIARAKVLVTGGTASGTLAGKLLDLDGVELRAGDVLVVPGRSSRRPGVRRRLLDPTRVIEVSGMRCTDGPQTLVHLAEYLDDLRWEQALESGLRQGHCTIQDIESMADTLNLSRLVGAARVRRVLALRLDGAPPTGSLLETLAVQLIRTLDVPQPVRQVVVRNRWGDFVARVDLAWPELGLFLELDGQGHLGQPVYDARRETAVVAATGWLCGRFTWWEMVHLPKSTARRIEALIGQALARPLAG